MKFLNAFIIVFLILFVNSTEFAEDVVAAKKDSIGTDTVKPAVSFAEKADTTFVSDTIRIERPFFMTLSIGHASAMDLPDSEYDDETTTRSYIKIAAMFHEKESTIYPSFIELDILKGLSQSNSGWIINYMFGKSFGGHYSDTGYLLIFDVGVGMTQFFGKHPGLQESDDRGIAGISRLGFGYNGFIFNFESNLILTRYYSLKIIAINLSYTF